MKCDVIVTIICGRTFNSTFLCILIQFIQKMILVVVTGFIRNLTPSVVSTCRGTKSEPFCALSTL